MMTRGGGLGGFGYKSDPVGHQVSVSRYLVGTGSTPRSASLVDDLPDVLDQAQTSSCTGHAVAVGVVASLGAQGHIVETPSPVGIYVGGLQIDRADRVPDGDPLPALLDEGAYPNTVMRGLIELGCGSTTDEWPTPFEFANSVIPEPKWGQEERQSAFRLLGYYKLGGVTLAQRVASFRKAIASGFAVCFSINVDTPFGEYTGGVFGAQVGESRGGHYLCAYGYEETSDGITIASFRNSWSSGWGENGNGRGDEEFIARWRDAYVMNVRPAA